MLKPGGIIGSREMIVASSFLEPSFGDLEGAWATFSKLLAANGGHPQLGKELKRSFLNAGFSNVRAAAAFEFFSVPEDVAFLHGFITDWFFSPGVITAATTYGMATHQQFDDWLLSLDRWKNDPGAFGAFAFGECLAGKP